MIRAFLVDDEEPARERLKRLLAEIDGVEVVGESADGEDALREIPRSKPDLVFLDIQMPVRTGMEVAATLPPPRPRIIFCTAFDQYAIQAFEQHAVDYLLKPLSRERLRAAVGKVRDTVESEERILRELSSASEAQALLYPSGCTDLATLEVSGACRSAREVGGDYYDFLPLGDGRLALVVGDVSGKGLFAGLLMAGLQGRIQSLARRYGDELEPFMAELNRVMHALTGSNRYATLFYGVYDDAARRLTYVNAGHPAALVIRPEGEAGEIGAGVEMLSATGTVVGLLPEALYHQASIRLAPGELLLIFSDGLLETQDSEGKELGIEGIVSVARKHSRGNASEIRDGILQEAEARRTGAPPEDDVTLVVARVR
ncbi:MAG TPA: SpoIIE family protein phosphatase [Candidatus Polarisedimenticolia bacterium]|jgi:sigma-B regulation protein RsbU (phosphoserine phosphatase)|nr:SpoIIE family protein phosphatase [Candidatus Polarisedimenticolia bacterium]